MTIFRIFHTTFLHPALFTLGFAVSASALACSSCGCTLSSDLVGQGFATSPGLRFELRYDFLDQAQLRTGTGTVKRAGVTLPPEREIEQSTRNQYLTLGIDYSPNQDWGVNVQLPYIYRDHSTIAEGDSDISASRTSGVGDVRVLGRYQGLSEEKNLGLQLGLKLPTGSQRDRFRSGPQQGEGLDRGLQAGTGTTDLLLGVFHFANLSKNWDYFSQAMIQVALDQRDEYKPGNALNLNLGVRYLASESVIPQLQVNAKTGKKDRGANADRDNSGGTLVDISPGVTVVLNQQWQAFGFVQVPVYQNAYGYQLAPRYTVSLGLRYSR